jgi:hypothetical protein
MIHFEGIAGAAIAIFISQLITNNWYVVYVSLRFFKIDIKTYVARGFIPLIIFAALLLPLSKYIEIMFANHISNTLLVAICGGLLTMVISTIGYLTMNRILAKRFC